LGIIIILEKGFPLEQGSKTGFPFDLAFTHKSFTWAEKHRISPDGKYLVYGVFTPPKKSPGSSLEAEPRIMPNGTPTNVVGSKLYIMEISTGETKPLLFGDKNSWRPSFSHDSRYVAFYSDAGGIPQLWVYDIKEGHSKKLSEVKIKAKLWPGDEAYWSKDDKEVFVPIDLERGEENLKENQESFESGEQKPTVRVYLSGGEKKKEEGKVSYDALQAHFMRENNATLGAINIETGDMRVVVPANSLPFPSVLRLSPSGKFLSYLSVFKLKGLTSTTTLFDLAVVSSERGLLKFKAEDLVVNEGDYFGLSYAWHPEQDILVFLKDKKLWFLDLDEKPMSGQLASQLGELAPYPLDFTRDGKGVLIGYNPVSDNDYTDPRPTSLALVPLDGSEPKKIQLENYLIFKEALNIGERILWQPEKDTVTLYLENPSSGEHILLRVNLITGEKKIIWKGFGRMSFVGSPISQNFILSIFENTSTPPDIYLFNKDFSARQRLTNIEPRFERIEVGAAESFETIVPQHDGSLTKVKTAVLLPPKAKKGDLLPTIVFIYGGSRLSRYSDRFGGGSPSTIPVLLFTTRGYAVLLPDMIIGPEGEAGNPLQEMVDVLLPQLHRAGELGYSDLTRMAIIGQSYGGYGTAAIISGTNIFRAAISISGLFDLPSLYSWMEEGGTVFGRNWSEKGQGRMGTHPWQDLKRYIENSPYYRADKINTPLLLLQGANDTTCPVEDARKMFNALERFEKTAQLAEYKGEGHTIDGWSLVNAVDAYKRIFNFLEKYLSENDCK